MDTNMTPALPSTPMTGTGGRRRLPAAQSGPSHQTEIQESVYVPPAFPETLEEESAPDQSFGVRLARRRLTPDTGYRRL